MDASDTASDFSRFRGVVVGPTTEVASGGIAHRNTLHAMGVRPWGERAPSAQRGVRYVGRRPALVVLETTRDLGARVAPRGAGAGCCCPQEPSR